MTLSCLILITTVLLINKVSLEVNVTKLVGDFAILPCLYTEGINQVNSVYWRHDDDMKVCEFNTGSSLSCENDNSRVESFPEEYKNGKYSIKIKDLRKTDAGVYSCYITPAYHHENIHLIIEEREKSSLIEEEQQQQQQRSHITAITVCVVFLVCCCLVLLHVLHRNKLCMFKSQ